MKILGLDPGTATTGFGVITSNGDENSLVEYGVISTPPGLPLGSRLQQIYRGVSQLVRLHEPDEAVVEQLFFGRNVTTALAVGHARGAILLALADAGIPQFEYTAVQVKQAIAGYGRSSKNQIQEMVKLLLHMRDLPEPNDAADALALALCHHGYRRMDAAVAASELQVGSS